VGKIITYQSSTKISRVYHEHPRRTMSPLPSRLWQQAWLEGVHSWESSLNCMLSLFLIVVASVLDQEQPIIISTHLRPPLFHRQSNIDLEKYKIQISTQYKESSRPMRSFDGIRKVLQLVTCLKHLSKEQM
jgi:hypothetical protein